MSSLENIFLNSKTKPEIVRCPNPNTLIIIDTREKQSLIATNLMSKKANVSFEKLEVGDYLIGDVLIERKTFSDFVGSMINKRLTEQLINLKKSEKCFLLIEGFDYDYSKFNVHENAIRGMLLCVAVDFGIPIIYTKDGEETANFLILLAKRDGTKNYSVRQTKSFKTPEEQKQFILEGFPGIGPVNAKKLLGNFKSLREIFNANEEMLDNVGLDEKRIEKFKRILDGENLS
ncbi:MAG: ERCC4 domain-containing protein [Candidatus Pacearchaeota archaeon]